MTVKRNRHSARAWWLVFSMLPVGVLSTTVLAQLPTSPNAQDSQQSDTQQKESTSDAAEQSLDALTVMIRQATASQATVELTARTFIHKDEVNAYKATYQISSSAPNRYKSHYESEDQGYRVYCDGENTAVQIGKDAFFKTAAPESLQTVVTELPVPLGPYPEPVMALTLAGVNAKGSLLTDMRSVEVIDREPYNQTPAVHLRGIQADGVQWDLWVATEKEKRQPLRMVIDLSKVVATGDEDTQLPEGFRYEIEMLFTLWRMSGKFEKPFFTYVPPAEVTEYASLEDYYESFEAAPQVHALVGKASLDFEAELLPPVERTKAVSDELADGEDTKDAAAETKPEAETVEPTIIKLSDLKGKVVILDFWATWCGPCISAMPVIEGVASKFADQGVEFYAINVGESTEDVKAFLQDAKVRPRVLLDPQSVLAEAYKAEAIPQTVLIGKDGRIEAVHVGYSSLEDLEQQLSEQLKILVNDGSLLTEPANQ